MIRNSRMMIIYSLVALIIIVFFWAGIFAPLENRLYDLLQVGSYLVSPTSPEQPVLVTIDQKSIEQLGGWPLSRANYARAITKLEQAGASAIGIDLIFTDKGEGDNKFKNITAAYDNIVLPLTADVSLLRTLRGEELKIKGLDKPIAELADNTVLGHINYLPDRDGIIRRLPLYFSYQEETYPSFSLVLARLGAGRELRIPGSEQMLINYPGPARTLPRISLFDLLNDNYNKQFFEDKIVIMGTATAGLGDRYMTPFSRYGYLRGVEINGQAVYNLINECYIVSFPTNYNMLLLAFFLIIHLMIISRPGSLQVSPLLTVFVIYIGFSIYCFYGLRLHLPLAVPVIGGLILDSTAFITHYFSSEADRKMVRKLFSRYVSREIMDELLANPRKAALGGSREEVSILFVDIRDFTDYASQVNPEKAVADLNTAYKQINEIIFKHNGTLDKYLGDGLLAFFGAPLAVKNHYHQAIQAAREINQLSQEEGIPFQLGIGLNLGQVLVGNIGSEERMDYTVIGSPVNRASRFVDKAEANEIIIGLPLWKKLSPTEQDFLKKEYQLVWRKLSLSSNETIDYVILRSEE